RPGREAAGGVLRGMLESGRVSVIDERDLPSVLSERRLAQVVDVGAAEELPRLTRGEAVVVGRVRRTAGGWTAFVRLVSADSGAVVAGGEASLPEAAAGKEADAFPPVAALVDAAHVFAETRDAGRIAAFAASRDASVPQRAAAVLALAESGSEELAIGDALRDREPMVRFAGALALGRIGARWGEGPLRKMLRDDPYWPARYAAAEALGRYASAASEGDLAAARASDASWRVRRQAASSLSEREKSR
ncbi:MAG: HEAT repeat domain-containing protein, partial [Elusimicrobia bacterium]|nr:HEAT repeat domain-containing protein [Elusimicrobiota bacterium]